MAKRGRPLKFKSVKKLQEQVDAYFEYCEKLILPHTITGLALWLDCDVETIKNYKERDEFSRSIKKAYLRCQAYAEKELYMKSKPTGPIFALKNYGWKDKQEVDANVNGSFTVNVVKYADPDDSA